MRKIHKIANIALIYTLIGVFLCSNLAYPAPISNTSLRLPLTSNNPTSQKRPKKLLNHARMKAGVNLKDIKSLGDLIMHRIAQGIKEGRVIFEPQSISIESLAIGEFEVEKRLLPFLAMKQLSYAKPISGQCVFCNPPQEEIIIDLGATSLKMPCLLLFNKHSYLKNQFILSPKKHSIEPSLVDVYNMLNLNEILGFYINVNIKGSGGTIPAHWHAHFHQERPPVFRLSGKSLLKGDGFEVSQIVGYPRPIFKFEGKNKLVVLYKIIKSLRDNMLTYNLLADPQGQIILIPRKSEYTNIEHLGDFSVGGTCLSGVWIPDARGEKNKNLAQLQGVIEKRFAAVTPQIFDLIIKETVCSGEDIYFVYDMLADLVSQKSPEKIRLVVKSKGTSKTKDNPDQKPASGQTLLREKRLKQLEGKVAAKKEEFDRVATSAEERLDRERALKRFDYLFEIGRDLLERYPELFDKYMEEIMDPLLTYDVRSINFILASAIFSFTKRLCPVNKKADIRSFKSFVEKEIKLAITKKKYWQRKFYYLPGLPIIVEDHGLSAESQRALYKAANLITKGNWLNKRPETLSYIESIIPFEEERDYGGFSGLLGHPFIGVTCPALEIAEVIIHEDSHCYIRANWPIMDDPNLEADIKSLFVHEGRLSCTPAHLLNELYAYGRGVEFILDVWDMPGSKEYDSETLERIYGYIGAVKHETDKLRQKKYEFLADYLTEVDELWNGLFPRIEWVQKEARLQDALKEIRTTRDSITKIIHNRNVRNITSKDAAGMPRFRILDIESMLGALDLDTDLKEVKNLIKSMMEVNKSIDTLEERSPAQPVEILHSKTLRAFNAAFKAIENLNLAIDGLAEFDIEELSILKRLSKTQQAVDKSI